MADIAFLGTGLFGAAFVQAGAQQGESVTAWNRSPHKAPTLDQAWCVQVQVAMVMGIDTVRRA